MTHFYPNDGIESVDARVRADQIDLLYEQAPGTLVTSFLVAIFLGFVHRDIVSMPDYFTWVTIMVIVAALRLGLARTYWRKRRLGGNPDRWRIPYDIGALMNGLLWGACVLLLFSSEHPVYQALLLVTIAAVIAGGVVALSSVREAAALFILPIVGAVSARLLAENTEAHIWLGIAALVYAAFMLRLAHRAHKSIKRSLQLRHENADLLADLAQSKANTESLNREISQARDEALHAAQVKSQFLATMSHEIRTPMNGVLGIADLLRITRLDEQQAQYVERIQRSGETLLTIINDVLDFSKIEAGKLRVEKISFNLAEAVQDVVSLQTEMAQHKNLGFHIETPENFETTWYEGDPVRLRQVLLNLLSNAIKFTDSGEVRMRVSTVQGGDGTILLRFDVTDTGIGISAEARKHIFGAFTQADSSTTRNFGGTGLGLAICRQLVELMGGEIGVQSEPGKGARFWFTVAGKQVEAAYERRDPNTTRDAPIGSAALGLRVLIAEDNPVNQEIAGEMLHALGCESIVVADGAAALRELAKETYDAVLMDCQMPRMDGLEATRLLRAKEQPGTECLPVIALTADAMPEDRERCLAAGMNDYIAKPMTMAQLRQTLVNNVAT